MNISQFSKIEVQIRMQWNLYADEFIQILFFCRIFNSYSKFKKTPLQNMTCSLKQIVINLFKIFSYESNSKPISKTSKSFCWPHKPRTNKPSEIRESYPKAESAMRECLMIDRIAVLAREIFIYATITSLKRKRKLILQLTGYTLCR